MIVGCINVAFSIPIHAVPPDTSNPAVASVVTAFDNAMAAAEAAGAFDTAAATNWTYTATGTSTTGGAFTSVITDNTDGAYVLKAAQAFDQLWRTDGLVQYSYNSTAPDRTTIYPYTWLTQLYTELAKGYLGYTGNKAYLVQAFTTLRRTGTAAGTESTMTYSNSKDGVGNYKNSATADTTTTTVNTTEVRALRAYNTYQDILDLSAAGGVITSFVFGLSGSTVRGSSSSRYDVFGAASTIRNNTPTRSHAQIDNLIAFYNHFLQNNHVGTAGQTDPYALDSAQINALVSSNTSVYNNAISASGLTVADVNRFLGASAVANVQAFIAECTDAKTLIDVKPSVEYFMTPATGFNAFIAGGDYQTMKLYDLQVLNAEQEAHYQAILALSPGLTAAAVAQYGLDLAQIDAARAALAYQLQATELLKAKEKVDLVALEYVAYKDAYTGDLPTSTTDQPAYDDLMNYLDAFFYGFDDAELLAIDNNLSNFYTALAAASPEVIAAVFPDGHGYIEEFRLGVSIEVMRRGVDSGVKDLVAFFNKILTDDLTQVSSAELVNRLNEAMNNKADYYDRMEAARAKIGTELTQQGFDALFTAFLPSIDEAIDKVAATMIGRLTAQVETAVSLYDGQTRYVDYENVSWLRKFLGNVESAIYDRLAGTPYMTADLEEKYTGLEEAILEKYNKFIENKAVDKYEQLKPEYPERAPYPGEDVARHGDEVYTVTDEKMDDTVSKLEQLLADPAFVALTGLDLQATLGDLTNSIYSDALVNTVMLSLYEAVLNGIEDMLADAPISSPAALNSCLAALGYNKIPDSVATVGGSAVSVTSVGLYSFHEILTATSGNTMNTVRLYPDMLASIMPPEYAAARAILSAVGPEVNWDTYRTNVWQNPTIKEIKWGIDEEPTDPADPLYALNGLPKEERFKRAMAVVFSGVWDLLAPLMLGQTMSVKNNKVNSETLQVSISYTANPRLRVQNLSLELAVKEGNDGYAKVLTPFFEGILNLDLEDIPSYQDLRTFTNARQLVDAIFNPLEYYLKNALGAKPLGSILDLLPNLAYAVTLDQILQALGGLQANLLIIADGPLQLCTSASNWAACNCLGTTVNGFMVKTVGCPGGACYAYPLDIVEMAGSSCSFACLGDETLLKSCFVNPNGCLSSCLLGCGGESESAPADCVCTTPLSFGKVLQYGEMVGKPSKRPPAEWVDYTPRIVTISVPYYVDELVEVPLLDGNGDPVPLLDGDGNPVLKLDGSGNPIPILDGNGDPVYALDGNGDKIPVLDSDGDPVLDGNGDPVYEYVYEYVYATTEELQTVTYWRDEDTTVYDRSTHTEDQLWYHIDADEGDVLLYLLRYLFGSLGSGGGGLISGLLGDEIGGLLGDALAGAGGNSDDAIAALVELFNPQPAGYYAMDQINWAYTDGSNPKVTYSDAWTKQDAQFVADNLIEYLDDFIRLLGIYDSNGKLYSTQGLFDELLGGLGTQLYSGDLLVKVGSVLKDLLTGLELGDEINGLIESQLGISLHAWDFVEDGYFDFADGDRAAFTDGLLQLLRPLYPLLAFLLNSEDIALFGNPELKLDGNGDPIPVLNGDGTQVLDANGDPVWEYTLGEPVISARGYDGYAYGVIPLLEALGAKDILTPAQYQAAIEKDPDALLTAILNPLLNVVDEVLADPINGLLSRLPDLLYFVESGGLQTSVDNVLHAAYVLIDTIRPIFPIELDVMRLLGDLLGVELDLSVNGITNLLVGYLNGELGTNFVLPADSLDFLLSGAVVPYTSRNGLEAYRLDTSGSYADLITGLLRFLVEFIYTQDNRNEIVNLLGGLVGTNLDFLKQIDALFSSLNEIMLTPNGTDRALATLLNIFYTVGTWGSGSANLLDRVNKNWVEILSALKNSGIGLLASFADGLERFLDNNFSDILDGEGIAASGVVPFFSAVAAWFQRLWEWIIYPFTWFFGLFC
jgi:hypothetical protein